MAAKPLDQLKVAIVHDWFVGGGAEKVVLEISQMFPDAPIFTSYCSPEWQQKLAPATILTGYLQNWPLSKLRKFLPPLRQRWFEKLDFTGYDLVISSSGAEAKGIKVPKGTVHVNYCHAPTHYYWSRYDDYIANPGFGIFNGLARVGLKALLKPMRKWDYEAAQRPNYLIANSSYIKDQIKQYYDREATVIHPPVDVERFESSKKHPRAGFVIAGRQTHYKRTDLAVAACTKLDLALTVLGSGPENAKLKAMAGPTIQFLDSPRDEVVVNHFQRSEAFLFPGVDDFGIVAVEALAAGTPVIAYKDGGALDYVKLGTGEFFDEQTVESLSEVLEQFPTEKYNNAAIAKQAQQFSAKDFQKKLRLALVNALR